MLAKKTLLYSNPSKKVYVDSISSNFRRFGTAKRLRQIWGLNDSSFNLIIFKSLKLFYLIKHYLTFGSAKPTGGK